MKFRKFAAITVLVLSSFAATTVAPSKSELEAMYDRAFHQFDTNNFDQALKELDAIDARQPDLAESQNLRGVILMRQAVYDKAEAALHEALRIDPKFWNARFNLAEIPFLQKNWAEARDRFQALLTGNASELQGEASQLIQYKILLTYLLEGRENMVDSILAKFELSPDTPAVHYANAAIAYNRKNEKEAKDWLTAANKNFSPQLNKLFAESLYEVGWMQKPVGEARAALELTSAAERTAKAKAFAKSKIDEAQQARQQRDLTAARKLVEEADAATPNQAPILNLQGEILLEQKDFDGAETSFKNALKADPKSRDAQYNLAQVPFKRKEYSKARDRFEALLAAIPGGEKNQDAQRVKFKVYLTLLLEGKDARAQKLMEQFQFTGDTPALYYAQAAWEFKHNNPNKANDWIVSARKIYSAPLNREYAESFYDLGWAQNPALAATTAPVVAEAATAETAPPIEPSPIPGTKLAQNKTVKGSSSAKGTDAVDGMEATTATASESPASVARTSAARGENASVPTVANSPSVEMPVASSSSPAATQAARATLPIEPAAIAEEKPAASAAPETSRPAASAPPVVATNSSTPATVLAPAQVREWTQPTFGERIERWANPQTLLVGGLLAGAAAILGWVAVPELRRRLMRTSHHRPTNGARNGFGSIKRSSNGNGNGARLVPRAQFAGGPPQISLQLKASEPSLRRTVLPVGKSQARVFGAEAAVADAAVEEVPNDIGFAPELTPSPEFVSDPMPEFGYAAEPPIEQVSEPIFAETAPAMPPMEESFVTAEIATPLVTDVPFVAEPEMVSLSGMSTEEPLSEPMTPEVMSEAEPVGQGQPVPHQMPAFSSEPFMPELTKPEPEPVFSNLAETAAIAAAASEIGAPRSSVESPSFAPTVVSTEPSAPQPTTTMPQPTQPSPVIRTAAPSGGAPQLQPSGAMHTAVQLMFSFEIASLQLTPSFKMGALQLRPTSKIVTMRLAGSQQPQPAMNLQVTFEISGIQLAGGTLGTVRLTPSQQQRPAGRSSSSFTVAGMQLVAGSEAAPLQLTPSQGQTSVNVAAGFQIATVEFSPSFEIASIVLNSTSRNVAVQLPGAASVDGAPNFEIANVQLSASGEIGLMQLNLAGARRA
jgi:tetratricopeptide (TPR) repeat protein